MNEQTHATELYDRFLDDVMQDPDAPAPVTNDLSPEALEWARQVVRIEQSNGPAPSDQTAAQARVWQRVIDNTFRITSTPGENLGWRAVLSLFGRARLRVGMTLASLLIAVAIGLYIAASQPASVSAQEVLEKAQVTLTSPADAGVKSFALTEIQRTVPGNLRLNAYAQLKGDESLLIETRRWYQAPNRWRSESQQDVVMPDGTRVRRERSVEVSDGTDLWRYYQNDNVVTVDPLDPHSNAKGMVSLFGQNAETLQELFAQASTCFAPQVTGSTTVAGRDTYVVDLGATRCRTASGPEMQGRVIIWVDKETFFVLKLEQHSTTDDKPIVTTEVTNVQYNSAIDPAQFSFAPPAGTNLMDNRPKPVPSAEQFNRQVRELAQQVGFTVLVPGYVPPGLVAREPRSDPMLDNMIELSYMPTDGPDRDSIANRMKGLGVREIPATSRLASTWTDGAEAVTIAGGKGWVRRGVRNPDNTGTESTVYVLRDNVLVSVSSFTISLDELMRVAGSLQPVAGPR